MNTNKRYIFGGGEANRTICEESGSEYLSRLSFIDIIERASLFRDSITFTFLKLALGPLNISIIFESFSPDG